MGRSRNLAAWCLVLAGAWAGCRVGYDEIFAIEENAGGDAGGSASGGSSGSNGATGGTESAGEAGAGATGGASVTAGSGGSAASGGSSATAGEGGAPGIGGGGGADDGAGGRGGSSGGAAGASGGTTSGASGEGGDGGEMSGASGEGGSGGASDAGMGGVSGGGTGGALGAGGFAGASSLGDCQTKTFGGHDYVFCNVNLAWTVARDNCASIGMFLVRVNDAAESQWVYDNVYDTPPRQGVWIGANDVAQEGEWRWPDGTLFWLGDSSGAAQNGLFNAWYSTQPSGQEPRDCAAMDGNTLGWYDLDCTIPQPYACESP